MSGSGGVGGGGPSCGNSIPEGAEVCDPPFSENNCGGLHANYKPGATPACGEIESNVCLACVMAAGVSDFDCANETGNAAAGPAAGQPLKALCYKVLDCIYDTKCAATDSFDCYCGTSGAACQTGGGNGLCRTELEAALESTAFGDVGSRFGDPSYAGGVAIVRVDGARDMCDATCGTE